MNTESSPAQKVTVVGGGITGIVSALLHAKKGNQVTLVEAAPELGGLYRSAVESDGFTFDIGSRLPLSTGIAELDTMLFDTLPAEDWWSFKDSLREYGYHFGRLNETSNCLDARQLPPSEHLKAVGEFMAINPDQSATGENLAELVQKTHGPTISDQLFRPALQKLTGLPMEELSPMSHRIHGLNRVILFDEEVTSLLKSIPYFDSHLAHNDAKIRISPTWKYYPKSGGCSEFIFHLERLLDEAGITVRTSTQIRGADLENGIISSLKTENDTIETDHLVWTVPPIFLMRGLGWDTSNFSPPQFRSCAIFHFTFDQEITTDGHYVYCYDNDKKTYRTTLYENMALEERKAPPHHMTIESFLESPDADLDALAAELWQEQKDMGLIHQDSKILFQKHHTLPNGWPALTNEFFEAQDTQREMLTEKIDNISLFGRASGAHHLIPQLCHIWQSTM